MIECEREILEVKNLSAQICVTHGLSAFGLRAG